MEDKALRNKQILARLTIDEYQQKMVASSNTLQMNKSDYMRMKILTESHAQIIDPRDIHAITNHWVGASQITRRTRKIHNSFHMN